MPSSTPHGRSAPSPPVVLPAPGSGRRGTAGTRRVSVHGDQYPWSMGQDGDVRSGRHCVLALHAQMVFVAKYASGVLAVHLAARNRGGLPRLRMRACRVRRRRRHVRLLVAFPHGGAVPAGQRAGTSPPPGSSVSPASSGCGTGCRCWRTAASWRTANVIWCTGGAPGSTPASPGSTCGVRGAGRTAPGARGGRPPARSVLRRPALPVRGVLGHDPRRRQGRRARRPRHRDTAGQGPSSRRRTPRKRPFRVSARASLGLAMSNLRLPEAHLMGLGTGILQVVAPGRLSWPAWTAMPAAGRCSLPACRWGHGWCGRPPASTSNGRTSSSAAGRTPSAGTRCTSPGLSATWRSRLSPAPPGPCCSCRWCCG